MISLSTDILRIGFMKVLGFLVGLLLMGAIGLAVTAQDDTPESTCTSEQWTENQTGIISILQELSTSSDPLLTLLHAEAAIETVRAICTGGAWSSEDYSNNSNVIGPIILTGTLYQATLKTAGSASVSITGVEGDCDEPNSLILSSDLDSEEVEESEALYEFDGCVGLIEVDGYGSPWSLTLTKIR
jgi:hypothetical protein